MSTNVHKNVSGMVFFLQKMLVLFYTNWDSEKIRQSSTDNVLNNIFVHSWYIEVSF